MSDGDLDIGWNTTGTIGMEGRIVLRVPVETARFLAGWIEAHQIPNSFGLVNGLKAALLMAEPWSEKGGEDE